MGCRAEKVCLSMNESLFNPDEPILPYNGTSGWSGSETSKARALRHDADGTTSKRQQAALRFLRSKGETGATWFELGEAFDLGHGSASGVLSNLHSVGLIQRLTEKRGGSQVYVIPESVADRELSAYRNNKTSRLQRRQSELQDIRDMICESPQMAVAYIDDELEEIRRSLPLEDQPRHA